MNLYMFISEKNIIPALQGDLNVPIKLNGLINQWQKITWQEYCANPSTEKLIAQQCVLVTDMLYRLVVIRGGAKLVAMVAIKNNYPEELSVFSITVHWNGTYHSTNCDALRVIII